MERDFISILQKPQHIIKRKRNGKSIQSRVHPQHKNPLSDKPTKLQILFSRKEKDKREEKKKTY